MSASDADEGTNGVVRYSLSSALSYPGSAGNEFYVDQTTGGLFTAIDLDKTDGEVVQLAAVAEDQPMVSTDRR